MENKNEISNISSNSEELNETVASTDNSPTEARSDRKFRIQTDWSDTGPEAQPIASSDESGNKIISIKNISYLLAHSGIEIILVFKI